MYLPLRRLPRREGILRTAFPLLVSSDTRLHRHMPFALASLRFFLGFPFGGVVSIAGCSAPD